jgi:RluA family pseudouridine synthase
MMVSSKVPHNAGAESLESYLSRRFTYLSAEEWRQRIGEGRIFHNGLLAGDACVQVCRGDTVAYDLPDFQEPPADFNYRIVYEDQWLLGIDKPGNLLVHKSGRSIRSNLVYQLRYCHLPAAYPGINAVNRLDRETSGIVLFAKELDVVRKMNEALSSRAIRKEYYAVVNGTPGQRSWNVCLPLGKDEGSSIHYKFRIDRDRGKYAETHFETLALLEGGMALLRIIPITGRTHQIRVHSLACGLPIVGDKLYGMSESDFIAWKNDPLRFGMAFPRQALHCASVAFDHPELKKPVLMCAPIPSDMRALLSV